MENFTILHPNLNQFKSEYPRKEKHSSRKLNSLKSFKLSAGSL